MQLKLHSKKKKMCRMCRMCKINTANSLCTWGFLPFQRHWSLNDLVLIGTVTGLIPADLVDEILYSKYYHLKPTRSLITAATNCPHMYSDLNTNSSNFIGRWSISSEDGVSSGYLHGLRSVPDDSLPTVVLVLAGSKQDKSSFESGPFLGDVNRIHGVKTQLPIVI